MTYAVADAFCKQVKGEMYLPLDYADVNMMVSVMLSGGLNYMWFPINDLDGSLKWANGSGKEIERDREGEVGISANQIFIYRFLTTKDLSKRLYLF